MRKSRSVYNNRTYILVDSRSTDISIIDRDLVDVLTDRKPAEQAFFLCFIGEERKALNECKGHLLSLFYQEIFHCMESFNL